MTSTTDRFDREQLAVEVACDDQATSAVASFAAVAADISCLKRSLAPVLPAGLHLGALSVLSVLERRGAARMSDVAERVHVDLSAVSRHVRALEDRGLLQRTADADDRRSQVLSVTTAGQETLAAVRAAAQQRLDRVLRRWSDDDVRTLRTLLDRLHADLDAAT